MATMDIITIDDVLRSQSSGTVVDFPGFDASEDVQVLRKAMKGLGTDEKPIIQILGNRSNRQRQDLKKIFKASYGRDLDNDLHSELSGNFRKLVEKIMLPRAELLATIIHDAVDGCGTRECDIIGVLCMLTNSEMEAVKNAYNKLYKRTMEKDLKGDLSGDFERLMLAILSGCREEPITEQLQEAISCGVTECLVDMAKVEKDVEDLFKAGEDRLGTEEEEFIRIFSLRSYWHLQYVDNIYSQRYGHGLAKALKNEMSGHLKKALATILASATDRYAFFAKELKESMEGLGTKDRKLMNLVAWRSEIDMVQICQAFEAAYGQSLQAWIEDDTSGDYKKLLLELVTRS